MFSSGLPDSLSRLASGLPLFAVPGWATSATSCRCDTGAYSNRSLMSVFWALVKGFRV